MTCHLKPLLAAKQFTNAQTQILSAIPEYMVADLFEMLNFVADWRGDKLDTALMSHVLDLILFFLRRPTSVLSPHLRATFGLTLFYGLLPGSARDGANAKFSETHATFKDGRQCLLIDSDISCQRYLAPCLLLLYGDVERTGHYEKIDHRRKLGKVLKYLWSLPSHRAAFQTLQMPLITAVRMKVNQCLWMKTSPRMGSKAQTMPRPGIAITSFASPMAS